MIRILLAAAALTVLPWLAPRPAYAQGEEQTLVDRATLAIQEMMSQTVSDDPQRMLSRARAVMICPQASSSAARAATASCLPAQGMGPGRIRRSTAWAAAASGCRSGSRTPSSS